MMKHVGLLFVLICLSILLPLNAQEKFIGEVELLELDEKTATFRAEGFAEKKKDVLDAAKKTVFYKLFYEGVEGFNNDQKLVEQEKKFWLENFFKGSKAPYNGFVKGAQLEGKVDETPTGEYTGFANVVVNYESLIRTMKINQVIIDENTLPKKEETTEKPRRKFGIEARENKAKQ
ncbi:MAG: hypothetical protein LUH22_00890 [Bacteroides sp.]|nr:hypothetical protein [Bacteroides sp.]